MCVGSISSADAAAFGFPVRNGSIRMRVSPSASSKQAWPRKRMSMSVCPFVLRDLELARQLPADRHAHEHAEARLLREQRAHGDQALVRVVAAKRLRDLAL